MKLREGPLLIPLVTNQMKSPAVLVDGTALGRTMKGVGRYAWQLCDALELAKPEGARLLIVTFEGDLPEFREGFRGEFIRCSYCPEVALGLKVIPRLIRETGAGVLIRPADKIGTRYRARTLTVCHDVNPLIWTEQAPRPMKRRLIDRTWEHLRGKALRASERVICNSEFIRSAAIRHFRLDPGKVGIGHCGVDPRIPAQVTAAGCEEVRGKWGPEGFLLAFATGDEREGYRILPELWAAACRAGYSGNLVLAGFDDTRAYGREMRNAFHRAGEVERVKFMPFLGENELETLSCLYAAADFYLETSRHEGFGMQLAEAMACGTTCFSSGRGALGEVGGGFPLLLKIDDPASAGRTVAESWKRGEHQRAAEHQITHAMRFDWSDARRETVEFAWNNV